MYKYVLHTYINALDELFKATVTRFLLKYSTHKHDAERINIIVKVCPVWVVVVCHYSTRGLVTHWY